MPRRTGKFTIGKMRVRLSEGNPRLGEALRRGRYSLRLSELEGFPKNGVLLVRLVKGLRLGEPKHCSSGIKTSN